MAVSHGDIYKFLLKEVLGLIMCHQNIYHLWTWRSRSEGRALSYQSFIMEITHVQENKPLSLRDTVCIYSVMADSSQPHGLQCSPCSSVQRSSCKNSGVVAISFSREVCWIYNFKSTLPKLADTEVSVLWVSNEWEVPLWDLAPGDGVRWEGFGSLAVNRRVHVKRSSNGKACCLLLTYWAAVGYQPKTKPVWSIILRVIKSRWQGGSTSIH